MSETLRKKLIRTEGIEALCDELHVQEPRRESVERALRDGSRIPRSLNYYIDRVARAHLATMIRAAPHALTTLGYTLVDLFEHQCYRGNEVSYLRSHHAYVVQTPQGRKPTTDRVVLVDDVPVGLDIKIARWSTTVDRGEGSGRRASVKNILRPEVYEQRLANMYGLFKTNEIGYVVIVPYDVWQKRERLSESGSGGQQSQLAQSVYGQFLAQGGCIVPFYADRHRFRAQVEAVVKNLGLPLKNLR